MTKPPGRWCAETETRVQFFDLDFTRLLGQFRRMHEILAQCVQSFE